MFPSDGLPEVPLARSKLAGLSYLEKGKSPRWVKAKHVLRKRKLIRGALLHSKQLERLMFFLMDDKLIVMTKPQQKQHS